MSESPLRGGRETVLEPVEVEAGAFEAAAMARGEPGVPRRFTWRGRIYEIAEVLTSERETGPCRSGSGETYVRRHVTTARTACGARVVLSAERRGGRKAMRWILRSIERP